MGEDDGMRILSIDIETRPNLAWVWDFWDQNIGLNQVKENGTMICFAAKWVGEDKIMFWSDFHSGHEVMVTSAWMLLDQADVVMGYNSKKFDVRHLNREFLLAGLQPPAPFQQIDLYQAWRSKFYTPSNKMEYVSKLVKCPHQKINTHGFELWRDCMAGDPKAWDKMRRYNRRDVRVTEELYDVIRAWIPGIPSHAAFTGAFVCPACGSDNIVEEGHAYTKQTMYKRWHCKDCGRWFRETTGGRVAHVTEVAG
jgi:predicted RNA-binding Zn-ribbon protein involved in translation (DUF1610 family)